MAFGKKTATKEPMETPSEASIPSSGGTETFLGEASVLSGDLFFSDDVRIEGRVEGQVRAARNVVVASPADVDASIEAECVEIHGKVVGDLHVRQQTVLRKSAHVEGEIHTAGIVVEQGARFRGCIVIGHDEDVKPPVRDAAPPKPVAVGDGMPSAQGPDASKD